MNDGEVQISSPHLADESSTLMLVDEKESACQSERTTTSPSAQELRGYTPNVFRGINTSGSYHVYGDLHLSAGKTDASHKACELPRGSHGEPATVVSHPVSRHPSFPAPIIRPAGSHRTLQRSDTSSGEEDGIQHPQTGCLRLSPSFIKGVICSPQSPLRSDCQPNSPTESNSSRNATLSLKQPPSCPKDSRARNWKKYKLIVLNQTPDEDNKETQGGSEGPAVSPTASPCRGVAVGGHCEGQTEEGAGEPREDGLMSQSIASCSSR